MILNWRTPPASTQPIYLSQCCKPQTGAHDFAPVSGVVVAVAGMAKISPFEVVRTSVPVIVGLLIVIARRGNYGAGHASSTPLLADSR